MRREARVQAHPVEPDLPRPTAERPGLGTRVERRRRLIHIAAPQAGCFTIAQARAAGNDRRARHHHLSYGNWRRTLAPGVFRLVRWPPDPFEHLRVWLLWAGPGASLTSWSALEVLRRTISGPRAAVHVIEPAGIVRRNDRRLVAPEPPPGATPGVVLHRNRDPYSDDVEIDGMRSVTVEAALATALMTERTVGLRRTLLEELVHREIRRDAGARSRLLTAAQGLSATRLRDLLYDAQWRPDHHLVEQSDE